MEARACPPGEWPAPRSSYLVCATARSGSTFLCRLLRATRRAGRPFEFLSQDRQPPPPPGRARPWLAAALQRGLGPDGVFGGKIFPHHVIALAAHGLALEDWLPGAVPVLLRRADLLAQAISFEIAEQTGQWNAWEPPRQSQPPRYDHAALARRLRYLLQCEAYWASWLRRFDRPALALVYEDLAARPGDSVNAVLARLGQPPAQLALAGQPLGLQRTARNAEWHGRFQDDLRRDGRSLAELIAELRRGGEPLEPATTLAVAAGG